MEDARFNQPAGAGLETAPLLLVCRFPVCTIVSLLEVPPSKRTSRDLNVAAGRNLRRLRNELGVSQDEFADLAGLHRTYIGAVERGERNITLQTLQRIAAALKVDPTDLLEEPNDA
jgi:DNA-binding XRE family transcriptional regulator